jgi:hypothetical protein
MVVGVVRPILVITLVMTTPPRSNREYHHMYICIYKLVLSGFRMPPNAAEGISKNNGYQ